MNRSVVLALLVLAPATAGALDTVQIPIGDIRAMTSSVGLRSNVAGLATDKLNNLFDGVLYSSWAGEAGKDGTWVRVAFAGTRYLSRVDVMPGCAGSNRTFSEFGRPKTVVLQAGERRVPIVVSDRRHEQSFTIEPPLPVAELTLQVRDAFRGRQGAVCLSELRFYEARLLGGLDERTRTAIEMHASALGSTMADGAVEALVGLGPAAVPRLAMALTDPNLTVQKHTLEALLRIGAPAGADALIRFNRESTEPSLRVLGLQALSRSGDERAVAILADVLKGNDRDLALIADEALRPFGRVALPVLRSVLADPRPVIVDRALRALRHANDPEVVTLVQPFATSAISSLRAAAAEGLGGSASEASLALLDALGSDRDASVRLAVAKALGRFDVAAARPLLARLLRDENHFVASEALGVLASNSAGVRSLADYIGESHAPLGNEAVQALAGSRSPVALQAMIDALRRGEYRFRVALRAGIASFGEPGLAALLDAALADSTLMADCEATLADHANEARPLVRRTIEGNPGAAPAFLVKALAVGADPSVLPVLDLAFHGGQSSTRAAAVRAFGSFPAAMVAGRLRDVLEGSDDALRVEAARAASRAGAVELGALIARSLEQQGIPAEVAIAALGRLRNPVAEDYMVAAFPQARMQVRLSILRACKRLETDRCLHLLYGAATDGDDAVRGEAMRLIAAR